MPPHTTKRLVRLFMHGTVGAALWLFASAIVFATGTSEVPNLSISIAYGVYYILRTKKSFGTMFLMAIVCGGVLLPTLQFYGCGLPSQGWALYFARSAFAGLLAGIAGELLVQTVGDSEKDSEETPGP